MSKAKRFFNQGAEAARQKALAEAQQVEQAELDRRRADPFNTLETLLILALAERFHPQISIAGKPKRFLDVAWNLKDKVKPDVMKTILKPLAGSPLPFKTLTEMVTNFQAFEQAYVEFVDTDHHGLLVYDKVIYPVRLIVEKGEGHMEWCVANELQLMRMAAHVACTAFGLDAIQCHVMFFRHYGFTHRMGSVGHRLVDIKTAYPDQDEASVVPLIQVVS